MKALGKKHKKALRAEKRVYLNAVTTYLPGTPAMLDLQSEVRAPLLERVRASLTATLNDEGHSAGSSGILSALNETRDRARVDFARASREWGIAFDRTSMEGFVAALSDVVASAEQQCQPSGTAKGNIFKARSFSLKDPHRQLSILNFKKNFRYHAALKYYIVISCCCCCC